MADPPTVSGGTVPRSRPPDKSNNRKPSLLPPTLPDSAMVCESISDLVYPSAASAHNNWPDPKTAAWPDPSLATTPIFFQSLPTPESDKCVHTPRPNSSHKNLRAHTFPPDAA